MIVYLKTRKTLRKYEKDFLIELETLSEEEKQNVLEKSKIANQISSDLNISLSAVYKTLGKLEELTLVFVEKFEFVDGKKIKFYKSRIGNAEIALHSDDTILKLYPNKISTNV